MKQTVEVKVTLTFEAENEINEEGKTELENNIIDGLNYVVEAGPGLCPEQRMNHEEHKQNIIKLVQEYFKSANIIHYTVESVLGDDEANWDIWIWFDEEIV